ncbi:MAG: cell division ATP-binding protein FtsE [Candidatus Magasanikbacteria bacterium]|jgi:cell division transport system ATP-binding protein|nr:cell division ATP-binding protein FtsE [Candidatus Magasanikbacteria bacterium]MBT4315341.1 cell division ATP-binding protein FtsE [Candidatus Magasanikbacteria bacterium]MBT4547214.1 cell division ATP-binding protein FtsE [Candidatus Magasanikbacteria bacterium]MBT6819454.1 cell division ATP-binding protein FtsE [Candidatus Magasanikbacteria bacterium]
MIKLKNISRYYTKDSVGVDDINLHIKSGEFVSVVGQSGTGKTTLVKLLIAEERPDSGILEIGGWDVSSIRQKDVPYLRRQIGVIFQDFKLLPQKTVYENVEFALQVAGVPGHRIADVVPKVLDVVGLANKTDRYPHQLSGGEQQRVVIARSLVHRPKILVADEPTGNLDSVNTEEIIEILKKINEFGTTILLVTHNREVVNRLRKRVITIHDGKIISDEEDSKYRL